MSSKVGKISKQWTGLVKEVFTKADNFGVSCKYLSLCDFLFLSVIFLLCVCVCGVYVLILLCVCGGVYVLILLCVGVCVS